MDFLDAWPAAERAAWTQGMLDALGWGLIFSTLLLLPLVVLFSRAMRRRRLWCSQQRREVEVVLDERGLPGFRHAVAVQRCSVFDPPTAITCRRHCLEAGYHRPWGIALHGLRDDVERIEVRGR